MPSQAPRHIKTIVGSNIKAAREAQSLTQAQLAQRLDMEPMNVSRWERGRVMPSVTSLVALGEALSIDPSWFYADHADPKAAA